MSPFQPEMMTDAGLDDDEVRWTARLYHAGIHEARRPIFKEKGEPYADVLLRAATFFLYAPVYETLTLEPPYYRKHRPDVAAFDFAEAPLFWAECGETTTEKLEFALKHSGAHEVVWMDFRPLAERAAAVRKGIHYRYLDTLTLIRIPPEVLPMIDLDHFWIDERDVERHYF